MVKIDITNDKVLKKPNIFSSPISINKKSKYSINKKITNKSPTKKTNSSKMFSKSNYLSTNGQYLLTDETETHSRLNTVQVLEILKTPSLKSNEENEFIKNKYKNILENLRKQKYTTSN